MPAFPSLATSIATIAALSIATNALPLLPRASTTTATILTENTNPGSLATSFVLSTHDARSSVYSMGGENQENTLPVELTITPTTLRQDENQSQQKDLYSRHCRQVYDELLRGTYDSPTTCSEFPEGVTLTDVLRHCMQVLPPENEVDSVKLQAKLEEFFDNANETHQDKDQGCSAGASIATGVAGGLGAAAMYFANRRHGVGGAGQQALRVELTFLTDVATNANLPAETAYSPGWDESDSE